MTAKILKSVVLATLLSTSTMTAFADTTDVVPAYETQSAMLQTADEALTAITRAHAARLALFDNDIDAAKARLTEARAEFDDAERVFNDLTIGDTEDPTNAARYLPFDMSMALTETFEPTPEKTEALQSASAMIQNGAGDEAIEVLRMAAIDVNVSAAMLPIAEVDTQLQMAQNYIDAGDYYQANLALKAVEDSVIVRSFSIDAIPQQGTTN